MMKILPLTTARLAKNKRLSKQKPQQAARRFSLVRLEFNAHLSLAEQRLSLAGKQLSNKELRLEANSTQVSHLLPRKLLHKPTTEVIYPCNLVIKDFEFTTKAQLIRCKQLSVDSSRSSQPRDSKFEVTLRLPHLTLEQAKILERLLLAYESTATSPARA